MSDMDQKASVIKTDLEYLDGEFKEPENKHRFNFDGKRSDLLDKYVEDDDHGGTPCHRDLDAKDELRPLGKRYRHLSAEEELDVGRRWRTDPAAKHRLITGNFSLVARIVRRRQRLGEFPQGHEDEGMAAGYLGLLDALEGFDPNKGRFYNWAWEFVKKRVREAGRGFVAVKPPGKKPKSRWSKPAKKKARNLQEPDGPVVEQVALLPPTARGDAGQRSLIRDGLCDESTPEDSLIDREEARLGLDAIQRGVASLNPRERRIFQARRLSDDPVTLEDLASEFVVSRERVRQIELAATAKVTALVRQFLKKNMSAP